MKNNSKFYEGLEKKKKEAEESGDLQVNMQLTRDYWL